MTMRSFLNGLSLSLVITAVMAGSAALTAKALAETPEKKGLAIAKEIDRRDLGFQNSSTVLTMTLKNKQGETSTRELRTDTLEVADPEVGDKTLTVFDHPRDIKGTAFLSFTKILDPDDQWLYLPALKRVKRISSANKSGPFVGSEFAYEDLTSFEVNKYTFVWLRDEACGEMQCCVVERRPLYEKSGYTRQVSWIDQEEYRILKTEFYDRRDSLLKTLTSTEWTQYLDQYWRAHNLEMVNHQTGKETILKFSPYKFQEGINEANFNKSRPARIR